MASLPIDKAAPLPRAIWVLGFVSLLMDVSSEMIHSLLPLFMVTTLGASAFTVGILEGLAEATALIVKLFSGALSDHLGKRKWLAALGYGLGAFAKPFFAFATSMPLVFAARMTDRIGKGIRGAPRDALVADLVPPAQYGAAYGLRQSLDTIGAFLGPLVAVALMVLWAGDFRAVFRVAVVPGVLAVLLLLVGLREPAPKANTNPHKPLRVARLRLLNAEYWWVVAIGGVFTLARFSEAFLVLRAQQTGLSVAWIPLVMVAMNVVYSLSAYPLGRLADRVSHDSLLACGLAVLIASDLVLAQPPGFLTLSAGVALWGLHMGLTQGLLASMVAKTSPPDLRGTAFGFFSLISGGALLVASAVAGLLWDAFGASFTFYAGACFAAAALLLLLARRRFVPL